VGAEGAAARDRRLRLHAGLVLRARAASPPTKAGVSSKRVWIPSGLNNSLRSSTSSSWCATGQETAAASATTGSRPADRRVKPEGERQVGLMRRVAKAGAFVFTFGPAEVWEEADGRRLLARRPRGDLRRRPARVPAELGRGERRQHQQDHRALAAR
jgi:hypothetical protein